MNPLTNVRNVAKLNENELRHGIFDHKKSWHSQYSDSAYIFIGGLPYDLTEGDVLCVFSQYGEIVNINLVRDKKTGKSKGYAFLCYEDQRSTILAVDNFNSIKLGGRTIRVDHVSEYRVPKGDEKDEDGKYKDKKEMGCAPKTPSPPPSDEELLEYKSDKKKKKKEKKKKKKKDKDKQNQSESSSNEDDELKISNRKSKNNKSGWDQKEQPKDRGNRKRSRSPPSREKKNHSSLDKSKRDDYRGRSPQSPSISPPPRKHRKDLSPPRRKSRSPDNHRRRNDRSPVLKKKHDSSSYDRKHHNNDTRRRDNHR